jgi:Na+-driven multidrug efflux pump
MPVGRLLLKFSLPAIGGMIVNSLYNLVDRIFVGRIGGLAMTGIGLSSFRRNRKIINSLK